jgi:hypothetical protein
MVMSEQTTDGKRDGARTLGVIFQLLAVASIIATLYAMAKVADLGTALGINNTKDPLLWIVLAIGIFMTCMFIGMGYALGMLCAIYDRQQPAQRMVTAIPAINTPKPPPYRPNPIGPATSGSTSPPSPAIGGRSPSPQRPVQPQALDVTEKSTLAEWLTRERHFRKPKSD